jgi:hypothetical protein
MIVPLATINFIQQKKGAGANNIHEPAITT